MTEAEKKMYDLLIRFSEIESPIIFKGALITKMILSENNYNDVERLTKDIDANWVGKSPSMDILKEEIQKAAGDKYTVEVMREYAVNRSAGFILRDIDTKEKIMSIDMDIKPSVGERTYYYGNASIRGVMPNEVVADKLSTTSTDAIYKHRAKDLIDLYTLTHCIDVKVEDIYTVLNNKNKELNSFEPFFTHKPEIEHAYNKLKGIKNKPEFSVVYNYISKFIEPFVDIEKQRKQKHWNSEKSIWEDTPIKEKTRTVSENAKSDEQSKKVDDQLSPTTSIHSRTKRKPKQNISTYDEKPSVFDEVEKIKAQQKNEPQKPVPAKSRNNNIDIDD